MKRKVFGKMAVFTLVLAFIMVVFASCDSAEISLVKNGTPNDYPDKTWGEVLEDTCEDCEWEYFEADDGDDIVEFNGVIEETDVPLCIQFDIDVEDETFKVNYMEVDGEDLDIYSMSAVVEELFE